MEQQDTTFSPIAIIFETREEATLFWDLMKDVTQDSAGFSIDQRDMADRISDMLSNEAHL